MRHHFVRKILMFFSISMFVSSMNANVASFEKQDQRQNDVRTENLKQHIQLLYSEIGIPEVPPRTTDTESFALNVSLYLKSASLSFSTSSQSARLTFALTFFWTHHMLTMLPQNLDGLALNPTKIWTPSIRIGSANQATKVLHQSLQVRTGKKGGFQLLQSVETTVECDNKPFSHPFSDNNCLLKITQDGTSRRLPHVDFSNQQCPINSMTKNAVILNYFLNYFPLEDTLLNHQKTLIIRICVGQTSRTALLLRSYLPSVIVQLLTCATLMHATRNVQSLLLLILLMIQLTNWLQQTSQTTVINSLDIWFAACIIFSACSTLLSLFLWDKKCAPNNHLSQSCTAPLNTNSCNSSRLGLRSPTSIITESLGPCDNLSTNAAEIFDKGRLRSTHFEQSSYTRVGLYIRLVFLITFLLFCIIYWVTIIVTMMRCPGSSHESGMNGCHERSSIEQLSNIASTRERLH